MTSTRAKKAKAFLQAILNESGDAPKSLRDSFHHLPPTTRNETTGYANDETLSLQPSISIQPAEWIVSLASKY
jgi:hypothetical protein